MELDEWLWRKKMTRVKMAQLIGVHAQTIHNVLIKRRTPALLTALAIMKLTEGVVGLEDLLNKEDKEAYLKIISN